jgi:hypothetical protein
LNTQQAGKWVLYRHLANNSPFYIGIGKDPNRPWSKRYRNKHWHNIVNKYSYEVEIIMYDLTEEEAIIKEIEFIALYGSRLCNMTKGGRGPSHLIYTKERNKKISESLKGKKHTEETIVKNRLSHVNRWSVIIDSVEYDSLRQASEILGVNRNTVKNRILSNNFPSYGRKRNQE